MGQFFSGVRSQLTVNPTLRSGVARLILILVLVGVFSTGCDNAASNSGSKASAEAESTRAGQSATQPPKAPTERLPYPRNQEDLDKTWDIIAAAKPMTKNDLYELIRHAKVEVSVDREVLQEMKVEPKVYEKIAERLLMRGLSKRGVEIDQTSDATLLLSIRGSSVALPSQRTDYVVPTYSIVFDLRLLVGGGIVKDNNFFPVSASIYHTRTWVGQSYGHLAYDKIYHSLRGNLNRLLEDIQELKGSNEVYNGGSTEVLTANLGHPPNFKNIRDDLSWVIKASTTGMTSIGSTSLTTLKNLFQTAEVGVRVTGWADAPYDIKQYETQFERLLSEGGLEVSPDYPAQVVARFDCVDVDARGVSGKYYDLQAWTTANHENFVFNFFNLAFGEEFSLRNSALVTTGTIFNGYMKKVETDPITALTTLELDSVDHLLSALNGGDLQYPSLYSLKALQKEADSARIKRMEAALAKAERAGYNLPESLPTIQQVSDAIQAGVLDPLNAHSKALRETRPDKNRPESIFQAILGGTRRFYLVVDDLKIHSFGYTEASFMSALRQGYVGVIYEYHPLDKERREQGGAEIASVSGLRAGLFKWDGPALTFVSDVRIEETTPLVVYKEYSN